jgi:hypothetical protein
MAKPRAVCTSAKASERKPEEPGMACKTTITHDRLREVLDYDPETGIFTWRVSRGKAKAGNQAGRVNQTTGYIEIGLDGVLVGAHILAWLYVHGEWPPSLIDHRNRIRTDNRLSNLRFATYSLNRFNAKINANNTSGQTGVIWHSKSKCWISVTYESGKKKQTCFRSKGEAISHREASKNPAV